MGNTKIYKMADDWVEVLRRTLSVWMDQGFRKLSNHGNVVRFVVIAASILLTAFCRRQPLNCHRPPPPSINLLLFSPPPQIGVSLEFKNHLLMLDPYPVVEGYEGVDLILQCCLQNRDLGLSALEEKFKSLTESDADKKALVDQAFRDVLAQLIIQDIGREAFESVVSSSITACRKDLCNATLPVILLADLFDCLTIDHCEHMFQFVESRVDIWKQELFFNNTKNNLLRMCNDLLRRLSRSQNTVFCGRILLFLAKFFPLSERSGLNIVSEFNLDNATVFGAKEDTHITTTVDDDSMTEPELEAPSSSISVDYNLYFKFWSLQDFFRNPNACYTKIAWRTFSSYASDVLTAFVSFKLDDVKSSRKEPTLPHKNFYFAKYLTNQKLLDLQLSDNNFRRFILLQFLILFQYLTSQVKFKPETNVLTDDQSSWIKDTTDSVYKLLTETPPDGARFAKTIKHILKREEYWNLWKNEGCPEFHSSKPDDVDRRFTPPERSRKRLAEAMTDSVRNSKILIGNNELTRLWNLCPDNMEACRSSKRDFLPTLEGFIEETGDTAAAAETQYNSDQGWRTLRLLARRSPHFFTSSNQPIRELPFYLRTMVRRLAKEMPLNNQQALPDEAKGEVVVKEEVGGAEEEEIEEELLDHNDDKAKTDENSNGREDSEPQPPVNLISPDLLQVIAKQIGTQWKRLALQLKREEDEVAYYEADNADVSEQARKMLVVWAETEPDLATPAALKEALLAVGLTALADAVSQHEDAT